MNRHLLAFFKRNIRPSLFIGLTLYALWLAYLLINANILFKDWEVLNIIFPDRKIEDPTGFKVSFAASTLDSFIFFVLIGSITLLLSLKKPEEEVFRKKLEYVFPSVDPNSNLHLYLREQVGSLACVGTCSKRILILQDLTPCKQYVKTVMKSENRIRNIHNNDLYANDEMSYSLAAEQVDFDTNVLGEVLSVKVSVPSRKNEQVLFELKAIEKLTKDKPNFTEKFRVHLEPHETAMYDVTCWVWNRLGVEKVNFTAGRFTELENFEIINKTGQSIKMEIITPPVTNSLFVPLVNKYKYRDRVLASDETFTFATKDKTPRDKMSLKFTLHQP